MKKNKTKMKKNRYQLVEIEWVDITHLNRSPDLDFVKEQGLIHFKNIGYLIYEDKEMISICFSYAVEKEGQVEAVDKFREVLSLPKSIVMKITKLR